MKKWMFGATAVAVVCAAGCGNKNQAGPANSGSPADTGFRVGVVTDEGGLKDQSFNTSAWRGAQKAQGELGIKVQAAESTGGETDYTRNLRSFAGQGYNIVFAVGYSMKDAIANVVPEYPKVNFVIIDGDAPKAANAEAIKFKEQDGSFLCGALAAGMSKSGTIGFIGGQHGPVISRFEDGYRAGAKMMNPNIKILSQYTESWIDSARGKEDATLQFSQGADIIFHASGKCGIGVIDAAKSQPKGHYAIGVDSDQDALAPGHVLTSMVKNIDNAVYDTIKTAKAGTFTAGEHVYGLKENGVGLSEMKYTKQDVPPAVMAKVDAFKAQIVSGKIVPPGTDDDLKAFYTKNNLKP